METALRISYQGGAASEALNTLINDHVETLEKLYGRLTSCQVIVQVPERHHRTTLDELASGGWTTKAGWKQRDAVSSDARRRRKGIIGG